jgi:type I restriction enzyme M protein
MVSNLSELQNRLWEAADQLRANSGLRASEYSTPVLGLIFLRYADLRFAAVHEELEGKGSGRRKIGPADYHARSVLHLPAESRFEHLVGLPEGADLGKALNDAMAAIERTNPDLEGVLPRAYSGLPNAVLVELLRLLRRLPDSMEGDGFGLIYEYFLGQFAFAEGQKGGEFFTPTSIVKLIVEVIEPYHGKIYDPACGSGGMFVQSAHFVERHRKDPGADLSIYGQEKTKDTVRIAKMNLAVHGLAGDIREANSYYEDLHGSVGAFDFVMANPPFNVDKVDKAKVVGDSRFPFGIPDVDNANYLWIQSFYSALNTNGRAGFVMANTADDAPRSEAAIRRQLINDKCVDVVVSVAGKFFFTVQLPVSLWFLDRGKRDTPRGEKVLFIDARGLYRDIDRAHREWTDDQLRLIAATVRLWRGEDLEDFHRDSELVAKMFPNSLYVDVAGFCREATLDEVADHGWTLSPGRYVGVSDEQDVTLDETDLAALVGQLDTETRTANQLGDTVVAQLRDLLSKASDR